MAACPSCGRTLATGARTCVYCAQGNTYQRRQELKVPAGTLPKRRRGIPWGKILIVLLILVGVAVYYSPAYNAKINGWFAYLKSQF
jgi:uncharacterized membrane protein YvbJ